MEGNKKNKNKDSDLKSALIKKALGYDYKETIEEYGVKEDGEVVLLKKKVTIKDVPPDVSAIKILIDDVPSIENLSDDELKKEKKRLLKLLKDKQKKGETK